MRRFTLLSAVLLLPLFLFSQDMQLGLSGGTALYQGDLQPTNDLSLEAIGKPGYTGGVHARFLHNHVFNTRLEFKYGLISGDDALSPELGRARRNLNFQNGIFEVSLVEEINIIPFDPSNGRSFSPYLFVGVAAYYHNPKAEYLGDLVALQPLGTEGQGMPGFDEKYSLIQFAVPFGGGLKIALTNSATLILEAGARKTFTDYLDDVSGYYVSDRELRAGNGQLAAELAYRQDEFDGTLWEGATGEILRGGPEYDDWYYFITIGLAVDIQADLLFGGSNGYGCPTW